MLTRLRTILSRLNLTALAATIIVATYWLTDQVTNHQPPAPHIDAQAAAAARAARPVQPHVFIYVIDSLRYETAMDATLMPHLAALREEGVSARLTTSYNSGTAVGLRDAFTGRSNAAVLATVATFIHTDAGVESIFHQMAQQGLVTVAYSAGFFSQFGEGVSRQVRVGLRPPWQEQHRYTLEAAATLNDGETNCAIGHLVYTDFLAHRYPVGSRRYAHAFQRADALIPQIRALLPPGATLVVTGDHGHDLQGRHGVGLDVPTLAVYAGPPFRSGVDLGTTPITSHRYLLSHAVGLPVTTVAYGGDLLPDALVHPPAIAETASSADSEPLLARLTWPLWLYLALYATIWFNLLCRDRSPLNWRGARMLVPWLGLAPFFLHGEVRLFAMGASAILLLVLLAHRLPFKSVLRWLILPVTVAIGFQSWGLVLTAARPWLDQLTPTQILLCWFVVTLVAAACSTPRNRPWLITGVFGAAAFLLHPVYHAYGFPGALTPLIGCWFACYLAALAREGRLRDFRSLAFVTLLAVGLFVMLQPYTLSVAEGSDFTRWHALVPGWTADRWNLLILPSLAAKALLYFPHRPTHRLSLILGLLLIAGVQVLELRWWSPAPHIRLVIIVCLFGSWLLALWRGRPETRLFGLTCLWVCHISWVNQTPRNFVETSLMIGAVILCAELLRRFPPRRSLRADYLVLACFGLLVTGWAGMRWSGKHLEWHTVYDFFPAGVVEQYVALFVPFIAVKGLLPWVFILLALHDRLAPHARLPSHELLILYSAKMLSLLMLTIGLGGTDLFNQNYLETASVVAAIAMLFLGVIMLPGAWTPPPRPAHRPVPA